MDPQPAPPASGRYWPIVFLVVIVASTVVLGYYRARPPVRDGGDAARKKAGPSAQTATPFIMPGIRQPPMVKAADAKLDDDAEVIGVAVEGHPRAYVVKAFHGNITHVVNDLLGDIPVTVAYCDKCKSAQVFTDPKRGSPLEVKLGGFSDGMLLHVNAVFYRHETLKPLSAENSVPFPHPSLAFETTTWKKWRERYPDTEVYVSAPAVELQ